MWVKRANISWGSGISCIFNCQIYDLSFSLPSDYSVWNLFLMLVRIQFSNQDHYIHMGRHIKARIRSKWTFFCVCLYDCNDPEWKNYIQTSTKNRFHTDYFTKKRERELHNVQFLGESNGFPSKKCAYYWKAIVAFLKQNGNVMCGYGSDCTLKILHV